MTRERMSRPSSSVPNQGLWDGVSRRAGKLIAAGSCGAIQGANRAKITKIMTNTTPVAASGLWRAFPTTERRNVMAEVDKLVCEFVLVINLLATASQALSGVLFSLVSGVPPSPHSLKSR